MCITIFEDKKVYLRILYMCVFLFIFCFLIFKGKQNLLMLILHLFTVRWGIFHAGMDNVFHLTNFVILHLTVQITVMKPCAVSENLKKSMFLGSYDYIFLVLFPRLS